MITLYLYQNCDTCRRARRFLENRAVLFEIVPIREEPPSVEILKRGLKACGGEVKRLFNTSGVRYRELGIKEKLPLLSDDEALALLASDGNLIKRPFLVSPKQILVGYHEPTWERAVPRLLQ